MNEKNLMGLASTYTLANGVEIPRVALGTWQSHEDEARVAVKAALELGYHHVDGAAVYHNEVEVGRGIRESGVRRGDLFVTSKVWNTDRGYDATKAAFEKTLSDLGLDYLDLYLIHWPANAKQFGDEATRINLDTWRAMTELYKEGRIRAIGVSNFLPHHLEPLMETEVAPMVDQVRFHPGCLQEETVTYCRDHGIIVEAWSPLGSGKMLANETVARIAAAHGKSAAQVLIRWSLQKGALPLPKSVTPARIESNAEVFDFELTETDMAALDAIDPVDHMDPDEIDF